MLQLEFWHEKSETVLVSAASSNGQPIPDVGDLADVLDAEGKCIYVKVTTRQFYYGPKGDLIRVRLYCDTL